MRHEGHRGAHQHHGRRGERVEGKSEGAKTFRRKRAIMFIEHLETKQAVLKKQLETPELQTANPMIVGELKATQASSAEFVQLFELHEFEEYAKMRCQKETDHNTEA